MTGHVKFGVRAALLLVIAGFGLALVGTVDRNLPGALAQDKKDKDKDKDKGQDKKLPDKKKELPKDKTPPLLELKGHKDWIYGAAFSKDGKYLITASRDKTVKVWDLKTGKDITTLTTKKTVMRVALFAPDGKEAITTTGGWDKKKKQWEGEIKFWDLEKGKEIKELKGHGAEIECAVLSPKGDQLLTGSEDTTALLWDLKNGKILQTLKGSKAKINSVAFDKDGGKIVTGSSLPATTIPPKKVPPKKGEKPAPEPLEVLVKIWNTADGKEVQSLKGPERDVSSVAFSPDGKYIAAGSWDGKIYLWEPDGKLAKKLEAQEGVLSISFSHDGKFLAASGWDDTTKVWNVETGKELFYRNGHKNSVTGVLFSPNDDRLVTVGIDQTVKVWEMPKDKK